MEKKRLQIGIYSPYFEILGGGERYILTIAELLSGKHTVFLYTSQSIKAKAEKMFHIDLRNVSFLPDNQFKTKSDVFFYMTDGSIFFPKAKKNFLIIQSPAHLPHLSFVDQMKLKNWQILCYSQFMQSIIKSRLNKTSNILPPPVDIQIFKAREKQKENSILSVGRFFSHLHNKKQDILVEQFKKYYKQYFIGWKLIIAGGLTDETGKIIIERLKKESKNLPITIEINPPFSQLRKLYQKAKIYWHAAGFGEDIQKFPEKAEHFGITTLEAMAAGAVPIVFRGGGQKDIVSDGKNGFLWDTPETLIEKTREVMNNDTLRIKFGEKAVARAEDFSKEHFYEKLETLITN